MHKKLFLVFRLMGWGSSQEWGFNGADTVDHDMELKCDKLFVAATYCMLGFDDLQDSHVCTKEKQCPCHL